MQSSVPASVHDSADDDRQLSEVDEDNLVGPASLPPTFPDLLAKRLSSPKPESELSTIASVDEGEDAESVKSGSFHDANFFFLKEPAPPKFSPLPQPYSFPF